jgi:GcrA cell cycle regulator
MSEPNRRIGTLWKPEWDNQVVVAWLAGTTLTDIGRSLGCCPKAVDRCRRRIGLPPRVNFSTWTPERDAMLRELLAKGFSARAIAAEIGNGITRCAVIGRAFRLGLSAAQSHAGKRIRDDLGDRKKEFVAMWRSGVRAEEMSKKFGVSQAVVYGLVRSLKIKRKRVPPIRLVPPRQTTPRPSTLEVLTLPDPDYADCLTLEEIKGTCHWPLGEPTKFCPRVACDIAHGSYCEQHYARSIQAPTRKTVIHPFRRAA